MSECSFEGCAGKVVRVRKNVEITKEAEEQDRLSEKGRTQVTYTLPNPDTVFVCTTCCREQPLKQFED